MRWRISIYNRSNLSFQNRGKMISVQVRPQCLQNILSNAGVRGGLPLFQCCSLDLVPSTTWLQNRELDDFLVIPNFSAAILSELCSLVKNFFVYSWHSFFPASRGLSRRGTNERKERVSLLSLIFASSWETSASREHSFEPRRAEWPKSDSSDDGEPQGSHWRQKSNFWDATASSLSFLPHCQSAPERLL